MLRIMLSELDYYKYRILFVYGIILLIFMWEIIFDGFGIHLFMLISSIIFFITTARYGSSCEREKRDRLHNLLPISVKTIGEQRLLLIVLHQACISLTWFVLLLTKYLQEAPGILWAMVSIFMFNMIIVCIITISDDLDFYGIRFHKPILALMITCSIVLYALQYKHFNSSNPDHYNIVAMLNAYSDFFRKPVGALFMGLLASILYYMVYKIYINRKSYLS